MPIVPVRGVGASGINRDTSPVLVDPQGWTDGKNVRFHNGSVHKIKGHQSILTTTVEPINMLYWDYDDVYIYANDSDIYTVAADNTSTKVSKAGGYSANGTWHSSLFNGGYTVIMNNTVDAPQYLQKGDTEFRDLPAWPKNTAAGVLRPFGYLLLAGDLTYDTDEWVATNAYTTNKVVIYQNNVYLADTDIAANATNPVDNANWLFQFPTERPGTLLVSSQATPGALPSSWTVGASLTTTADEFELSNTSPITEIVDYRGQAFIFTRDSIHSLQPAQGATGTRVQNLNYGYGALAIDCVTVYEGGLLAVSNDDIYVTGGSGQIQSISNHKVREYFFENLNNTHYRNTFTVNNLPEDEIWICFPDSDANENGSCNQALLWNYRDNTFSIREMPNVFAASLGYLPEDGAFNKQKPYLTFNGYRVSEASQQQEGEASGTQSNQSAAEVAVFTWDISGTSNKTVEGFNEVQTLTIEGAMENIPAVVDVQRVTITGRSNAVPVDNQEVVDFGIDSDFAGGADTPGDTLDYTFSGSFSSPVTFEGTSYYTFYPDTSSSLSLINNIQTIISDSEDLVDWLIATYNADTSSDKIGTASKVGTDTVRFTNTKSSDITFTSGTVDFGISLVDDADGNDVDFTGWTLNVTSSAFDNTGLTVSGVSSGRIRVDSVTFDGGNATFANEKSQSTFSIQGPKTDTYTLANRDTNGILSFSTWDLRNGNNSSSSSTVIFNSWNDWVGRYFAFDPSDGYPQYWEEGDSIKITNNQASAEFVIDTDSQITSNDTALKLKDISNATGIPSGTATADYSIENLDAISVSGTFDADANATTARNNLKSALEANTVFTDNFEFDTDSELASVAGGWDCRIIEIPTLVENDSSAIVYLPGNGSRNISVTTTDTIEDIVDKIVAETWDFGTVTKQSSDTVRISNSEEVPAKNTEPEPFGFIVGHYGNSNATGNLSISQTDINNSANKVAMIDTAPSGSGYYAQASTSSLTDSGNPNRFYSRYRSKEDKDYGDFMYTITQNSGSNTDPYLNVFQHGSDTDIAHSTYTVSDPEGAEITTFTSSVTDVNFNDIATILQRIKEAVDSNTETPINYTSGDPVNDSYVDLTADEAGAASGMWSVSINHNGASGPNAGDSSANVSVQAEGKDEDIAEVEFSISDPSGESIDTTLTGPKTQNQIASELREILIFDGWEATTNDNVISFTSDTEAPITGLFLYSDNEIYNDSEVTGTVAEETPGVSPIEASTYSVEDSDGTLLASGTFGDTDDSDDAGNYITDRATLRGRFVYDTDSDILTFTYDDAGARVRPTLTITNPSPGTGDLLANPTGSSKSGNDEDPTPSLYDFITPIGFTPSSLRIEGRNNTRTEVLNKIRDTINEETFEPVDINAIVIGNKLILIWAEYTVSGNFRITVDNQGGNGNIEFGSTSGIDITTDSTEIHAADISNTFNGEVFTAFVEKKVTDMGDLEATKWAKSIYPLLTGIGEVKVSVVGSNTAGKTVLFENGNQMTFKIEDDYKVDPRENGRFLNIRFESTDNDTWILDGYSLTTENDDRR